MAKYKIIPSSRTIVQSPISIGHKAEKGVQAIEFDLTAWVETYGSGTLTVIMRRWGDAIPYPIALEIDENNKATWTLSDIDTAKAGMAYAQLNYIVGDEVVKKSDIYTFRVMDSLVGEGEPPEAYEAWLEHLTHLAAEAMAEVLDIEGIVTDKTLTVDGGIADGKATGDALALKADKSTTYTKTEVDRMIEGVEIETDTTLTIEGAAADAAETGRQIGLLKADLEDLDDRVDALESGGGGSGLTDDVKTALMNLVNHLAWDGDDPTGQTYITALSNALYPPANLVSISAIYTQSGTVYDTDTLDSLKSSLVVTATMSDQTTRTITDYTLSGTLTAGTSTITVTYGGKTTTFSVTVTANQYLAYWDFTQSLVDTVNGYEFTLSKGTDIGTLERTSAGLVFSSPDTKPYGAVAKLDDSVVFPKGSKLTIEFGASDAQMTKNSGKASGTTYGFGNGGLLGGIISLMWKGSKDKFWSYESDWTDRWISTTPDYFNNKTMVIEVASDKTRTVTVDGVAFGTVPGSAISSDTYTFYFGRKPNTDQTFHDIVIKKAYVETLSS